MSAAGCVASAECLSITVEVLKAGLSDVEYGAEDPCLSTQVPPGYAEHLAFSDHLCRFDSLDHRPSRYLRPRSLYRAQAPLHVPVIGFDAVIAIPASSLAATSHNATLELKLSDRRRIAVQAISGEYTGRSICRGWPTPCVPGTAWLPRGHASPRGRIHSLAIAV